MTTLKLFFLLAIFTLAFLVIVLPLNAVLCDSNSRLLRKIADYLVPAIVVMTLGIACFAGYLVMELLK